MRQHFLLAVAGLLIASVPACEAASQQSPSARPAIRLPRGTALLVRTDYGVSSSAAKVGDPVYMRVAAPVRQKDVVVIPEGSKVTGRVSEVSPPGRFGRPGVLVIEMESVDVGEGRIRLSGSTADRGKAQAALVSDGVVSVPLGALGKGNRANIAAGTEIVAYTDQDY